MKRFNLTRVLLAVLMSVLPWAVTNATDVNTPLVPGKYYVFRHVQAETSTGVTGQIRYMCVNGTVLNAEVVDTPSGDVFDNRKYIFTVEDAGDGKYFIRNLGTGLYLHRPGIVETNTNVSTNSYPTLDDNAYWITNSFVTSDPTAFAFGDAVQMASGPVISELYFLHNNNSNNNTTYDKRVVRWSTGTTTPHNSLWYVEEVVGLPEYFVSFENLETTCTRGDRNPGIVTVTTSQGAQSPSPAWAPTTGHKLYINRTAGQTDEFIVNAKAGEQFTIEHTGGNENWMHFYVYLDYGQDGQFSWDVDRSNHCLLAGTDLVGYSFWSYNISSDTGGWDSQGSYYTGDGRNRKDIPGTILAPTEPGDYRMRVKIDWNNIDPSGATSMNGNGGGILDFTLRVTGSVYNLTYEDTSGHSIDAVRVYTSSGTMPCGASASINEDVTPELFMGEDWQRLNPTGFRAGGTTYATWADMKKNASSNDVTVKLAPSTYNVTTGKYYSLKHVQGDEIRYAYVNGTVLNADVTSSPATTKDLNHVFRLDDAGNGTFYFYNAGTNLYAKRPGSVVNNTNIPTSETATVLNNAYYVTNAMVASDEAAFALGDASVLNDPLYQIGQQYYMHTNGNERVVRWETAHSANNSLWYFEEVTVPVVTLTFQEKDGPIVTPNFTVGGADKSLTASGKMQAWATSLSVDGYGISKYTLNGTEYTTAAAFFTALHNLDADATATITLVAEYTMTYQNAAGEEISIKQMASNGTLSDAAKLSSVAEPYAFICDDDFMRRTVTKYTCGAGVYNSWAELTASVTTSQPVTATMSDPAIKTGRHYYAIQHAVDGHTQCMYISTSDGNVAKVDNSMDDVANINSSKHLFRFEKGTSGTYYIYNLGANLYLHRPGKVEENYCISTSASATEADNAYRMTDAIIASNTTVWALADASQITNPFSNTSSHYYVHNNHSGSSTNVVRWGTDRGGSNSQWWIKEITVPVVTLSFECDGNPITPTFSAAGSDNSLPAGQILAWTTGLTIEGAYDVSEYNLNGTTYTTYETFFSALHDLDADATATITLTHNTLAEEMNGKQYYIKAVVDDEAGKYYYLRNTAGTTLTASTAGNDLADNNKWTCSTMTENGTLYFNFRNVATGNYLAHKVTQAAPYKIRLDDASKFVTGAYGIWNIAAARYLTTNKTSGALDQDSNMQFSTSWTDCYKFELVDPSKRCVQFTSNPANVDFALTAGGDDVNGTNYVFTTGANPATEFTVKSGSYNNYYFTLKGFGDGNTATYTLPANSTENGAVTVNFDWSIISANYGDTWVRIQNNHVNKCAATYADGEDTRVKLFDKTSDDSQKWCFVQKAGGFWIYNKAIGDTKVLGLEAAAANAVAVKMQDPVENDHNQLWTLTWNGSSVAIVPIDNTSVGWNPYAGDANPIKMFDANGQVSRWQFNISGKTTYTDRDGNFIEEGRRYTLISAYDGYYQKQGHYKAAYVNSSSKQLCWKQYDPNSEDFYFTARITDSGDLTFESSANSGYYMRSFVSNNMYLVQPDAETTAGIITFTDLGDGQVNVRVDGSNPFHTNYHNSGSGTGSNIIPYPGGKNGASAWYLQYAPTKSEEQIRYTNEIANRVAAANEAARQAARDALGEAIASVEVGTDLGDVTQEAYDDAVAVYNDLLKTKDEYNTARTTLLSSIKVPTVGLYYKFANRKSRTAETVENGWTVTPEKNRVLNVNTDNVMTWGLEKDGSLYDIWRVDAVNPENGGQIALLNVGSGTYMNATTGSGTNTTTKSSVTYLTFEGNGKNDENTVCKLKSLTPSSGHYYLHPNGHDNGAGTAGDVILWNGDYNLWEMIPVGEEVVNEIAEGEDARLNSRDSLRNYIDSLSVFVAITNQQPIAYYNNISELLATATAAADNVTLLKSEYDAAITTLLAGFKAAEPIAPNATKTYMVVSEDGLKALDKDGTLKDLDDTNNNQLWWIAKNGDGSFTLTNDNDASTQTLTLTRVGNDMYTIAGVTALATGKYYIRRAEEREDHNLLTDGLTYMFTNQGTSKVLASADMWINQTAMKTAVNDGTDHTQLWTVTKLPGADRYLLKNVEYLRYLEQANLPGTVIGTTTKTVVWRAVSTNASDAGDGSQIKLHTTIHTSQTFTLSDNGSPCIRWEDAGGAERNTWTVAQVNAVVVPEPELQVVTIKNYGTNKYMQAIGTSATHTASGSLNSDPDYWRWVLMERETTDANGNPETVYGVRNVKSGLYIQDVTDNDQKVTANIQPAWFHKVDSVLNGYACVAFKSNTNVRYLNASGGNDYIIGWSGRDNNSHWIIQNVYDGAELMTTTESALQAAADAYEGYSAPYDGMICRIYNPTRGGYLDENYNAMTPVGQSLNASKPSQYWKLVYDPESGMYNIQNLYTSHFIKNQPSWNAQFRMTSTASEKGTFAIMQNKKIQTARYYDILDSQSGHGMHYQSGGAMVIWSISSSNSVSASEWRFAPVALTDDEIEAIQKKWETNSQMLANISKYQGILDQIFDDKACTTVKTSLTDDQYTTLVAQLPDLLADMCNKIKTDNWPEYTSGTNWDKEFRIRDYSVVSNSNSMAWNVVKVGYAFSQLNDPTGVKAETNEIVAIMVDSDTPANSTLKLECQSGFGMTGDQYTLHKGLNLLAMPKDCNLFIYYMINGYTDEEKYYIRNFPDIKIHIEGGEVYGMLDRTKYASREAANDAYATMISDGLIRNAQMAHIKSECILFNFNSTGTINAVSKGGFTWPNGTKDPAGTMRVAEVADIWDNMIKSQQWLMGLRDDQLQKDSEGNNLKGDVISTYVPHLDLRFNNRYMATERSGGYMNAITRGAMYTTGTESSILNFANLAAGGQWGPAHEHGHDHQQLITMVGTTEVSNNLLANVSNYRHGTLVSRGNSLPEVTNVYAAGKHWFDIGIWAQTQMYYKLYLYYHVAGHNPEFYPKVFQWLRKNPLTHYTGGSIPASQDYLKFALACSEVAGEDLSEFFEAYGMFREINNTVSPSATFQTVGGHNCRVIGDYGNYYVYTSASMIADMKAKIQTCGARNGNILFIDDRITRDVITSENSLAVLNEWYAENTPKKDRSDGGKVGTYGDHGQWSDFVGDSDELVGYRVYDSDGNLVYFTSTDTQYTNYITNNPGVVGAVCLADGTIKEDGIGNYNITTIEHDNNGNVKMTVIEETPGNLRPVLHTNDVALVTWKDGSTPTGYGYANDNNVIVPDAEGDLVTHNLVIIDKQCFGLPAIDGGDGSVRTMTAGDAPVFTDQFTYSRSNTNGWNSVCLPFALSDSDLPDGSAIYVLKEADKGAEKIYLVETDNVEAGQPCFVKCETNDNWNITRSIGELVTTSVNTHPITSGACINGSFIKRTIGEGHYKLNTNGDAFGVTTKAGTITPMRAYIDVPDGATLGIRAFTLVIGTNTPTGVETVTHKLQPGLYYDLSGRQIEKPTPGKPYIYNGKVRMAQ